MNVLIIEPLWQHTEVIGCWLDYFSNSTSTINISIYYPHYNKNSHNYLHIWQKLFNYTLIIDGNFNPSSYNIILINTATADLVERLQPLFAPAKIIAIEHYNVQTIRNSRLVADLRLCDIPVQPFTDAANMVLPICNRLADLLQPCRSAIPNSRKISIIGNSFLNMPSNLFCQLLQQICDHNYSITIILYGYNNLSTYNLPNSVIIKKDISAIDLYTEIETSRFILFIPAVHHYINQGSGALVHSLQFGRPLITFDNYLHLYNLQTHYKLGSAELYAQMDDDNYYRSVQQYLQVRLNEILGKNKQILEAKISRLLTNN